MKKSLLLAAFAILTLIVGISFTVLRAGTSKDGDDLAGAWRSKVKFTAGDYAPFNDIEFMYAFNAGGTMTESSNYDAQPPCPPAYGIWRKTGPRRYEAKYQVFFTKADSIMDRISKGSGWLADGYGELNEKITLSADGDSYTATMKFEIFDAQGKLTDRGGDGSVQAKRIKF